MRTIGILTTVVVAIGALFALFVGVRSVPDVKRYLRIRSM
jgi:uncharacterized membrane protein YuzA (DUF378 family)